MTTEPSHCEICGVALSADEIEAAREAGEPYLCAVHATEELPAIDPDAEPAAEEA